MYSFVIGPKTYDFCLHYFDSYCFALYYIFVGSYFWVMFLSSLLVIVKSVNVSFSFVFYDDIAPSYFLMYVLIPYQKIDYALTTNDHQIMTLLTMMRNHIRIYFPSVFRLDY